MTSHLLDGGIHPHYLYRWLDAHVDHKPQDQYELADIFELADRLISYDPRSYEVLVGVRPLPGSTGTPVGWLDTQEVLSWLRREGLESKGLRLGGGILLEVHARDPWSAAELAAQQLERFQARIRIGTRGGELGIVGTWVAGHADKSVGIRTHREVDVLALTREASLFASSQVGVVDAALELLAPLQDGPMASAIAGGWAAVESSLVDPSDRENVVAADRLASIVTCSWPRAELTWLAHTHIRNGSNQLASDLKDAGTNAKRCGLLLAALQRGESIAGATPSDDTAGARMLALATQPQRVLLDVHNHLSRTFRRLYRQRNLLLHGGLVNAVAAPAALRTSAPLVGAGFDRITHAWLVEKLEPLDLAARAAVRMKTAGDAGGRAITALLEP